MQTVIGYLGAFAAMFFFGTAYVPAKIYPTYDGIIFQWFMCSGIISVGFLWGLLANHWNEVAESGMYLFPEGLIGGSLWAVANLLIPTVVNTIGLGMGFMLWNGVNIVIGYLVGRIGLFGIPPSVPTHPQLSEIGLIVILISIGIFGFVEPERISKDTSSSRSTRTPTMESFSPPILHQEQECQPLLIPHDRKKMKHSISLPEDSQSIESRRSSRFRRLSSIAAVLAHDTMPYYGPFGTSVDITTSESFDGYDELKSVKMLGIILSIIVGIILGNCLTPYLLWQDKCVPSKPMAPIYVDCNPMNFMFSQCVGIYFTSTIAFVLYSTFHKFTKSKMPRSVIRPAYSSGVIWGFGLGGQLLASGHLGYSVAYPLTCIGPAVVSMLWSAVYFQEIKGKRNIRFMVTAMSIAIIGIVLISISA